MAALTLDFRKHSAPTPADDMAAQIITDWKLHTGLQATWILCLSILPPDSGTLISKLNTKCTFIRKEDFGPLSNSQVLFLLSPGKMLLTMFLFQKWLGSPFPKDVWAWWLLMHWLQLQFTPCEALPSVWILTHILCCKFAVTIFSSQSGISRVYTSRFGNGMVRLEPQPRWYWKNDQVPGTLPSGKIPQSEPYQTVPCHTMQWKSTNTVKNYGTWEVRSCLQHLAHKLAIGSQIWDNNEQNKHYFGHTKSCASTILNKC